MALLPVTFTDLEGHYAFAVWCLSIRHTSGNAVWLSTICLHMNQKRTWIVISTICSRLKDFSRSQPVTYVIHGLSP